MTLAPNVRGRIEGGTERKKDIQVHSSDLKSDLIKLPFTSRLTDLDSVPAVFEAVHVYLPLCLWPTLVIKSMLPLDPIGVVMMPREDDMLSP